LLEQRPRRNRLRGSQRQVNCLVTHDLLTLLAQHEAQEFGERWIQGLAGCSIDIEINQSRQRVRGLRDIFVTRRDVRPVTLLGQRQHFHRGVDIRDTGVSDRIAILLDISRKREHQFLVTNSLAPFAALAVDTQYMLAHEFLKPVPWLNAVGMDGFVRPFAGRAQLSPRGDLSTAAKEGAGIYGIQLIETDVLDGVFLVDEKGYRIEKTEMPPEMGTLKGG
jgi:hypothetical protein